MDQELETMVSENTEFGPKRKVNPLILEMMANDYKCQQGFLFKIDWFVTE